MGLTGLKGDVRRITALDPLGFSDISERDAVLYIANGVYDPAHIREYSAAGIGPELAGDMESLDL